MRKSIALLIIISLFNTTAFALSAESYVLMDASSGRVLMEQNANLRRGMASTTKIMTAIIAIEYGNLEDVVTVSKSAAYVEGSSMWLKEGEKIALKSLLYGLMLNSGNDAATAIAEHIGGSVEGFAILMNNKAKELGLKDTSFTNPHGLDDENHYTTAHELGIITCYALKNEIFNDIVRTKMKTIEGLENGITRTLNNHNKMLKLYDNADGVKTGFTKKCGRCLVSSATQDGLRLVAVTLKAPDDWNDHMNMFNYGFSKYKSYNALGKGSYIKSIHTSENLYLKTYINDDLKMAVKSNEKPEIIYNLPDNVNIPVLKDTKIGTASLILNGKVYKTVDVLAKEGITCVEPDGVFKLIKSLYMNLLSYYRNV